MGEMQFTGTQEEWEAFVLLNKQNNMAQQSSVEWLEKEIYARGPIGEDTPTWLKELYQQAKAMHKEEITNAYIFGIKDEYVIGAKQYYNTTFKSE